MSILVTGGAGFIGSLLCQSLLDKGMEVVCVDDFNGYYNPKFKENNIKNFSKNKNFHLFRIDITEINKLNYVFKKNEVEIILHLAARAGVRASIENPELYEKVNVLGTLNLLNLARDFKIKNFVFGSSSSVYGSIKETPFSEDMKTDTPISPYAATKKSGELMCYAYSSIYGIPMTCLRLFTVYGPRGRPDMAPYKFTQLIHEGKELPIYGDGKSKRDYTFVDDIVSGFMACLEKQFKFEVINLGNSNPIELKTLISLIEKNAGKKAKIKNLPMQPGDVEITYADIKKAKRLLGWEPEVRIEEGIKKTVEWYKNERL